jgi:soluble lytic murein transglycosylase-like protein
MQSLYINKISIGLVLITLSGVNGFYFLATGQDRLETNLAANQVLSQVLDRIDLPLNYPEKTITHLTLTSQELESSVTTYDHWIKAACRKHSLDPALVKAVIHAESRFDPMAVSPKGAIGLMQIDPNTVKELGIKDPFNPKYNIDGGVRYLKELLDAFEGDQKLALAAYNAGPSQVYRHNGVPPFKDTKNYLKRVFRYIAYYQKNLIS